MVRTRIASCPCYLLMIYLPYLLAKWFDSLQAKNISKKVPSLVSWNVLASYPLPCLLKSLLARGIKGWQVGGGEPATALKFPKRHFLGWLIKLHMLAYRSFPGFKEKREKGDGSESWAMKEKEKYPKPMERRLTHLCVRKDRNPGDRAAFHCFFPCFEDC